MEQARPNIEMNTPSLDQIGALITALAKGETAADAFNEYARDHDNNALRRANLRCYLRAMAERMPDTLLVMEAPGYRGCRLTGVPVTSRKLLLGGVPELHIFGGDYGYRDVDEPGFEAIYGEQTATIVWGTLAKLRVLPFIWNTFPYHPHKPGQPLTNRKPRKAEREQGANFLQQIIEMWQFKQVFAVGNVAYDTLRERSIDCAKVRHPAQGGKHDFVAGLTALLAD